MTENIVDQLTRHAMANQDTMYDQSDLWAWMSSADVLLVKAADRIADVEAERDEARETNKRLQRRLQRLEGGVVSRAFRRRLSFLEWYREHDGMRWSREFKARVAAEAERDALKARVEPLAQFARWIMQEIVFHGYDADGGELQDKAEKLGLIVKTQYDPELHGSSECGEPGDDWWVMSPLLRASEGGAGTAASLLSEGDGR